MKTPVKVSIMKVSGEDEVVRLSIFLGNAERTVHVVEMTMENFARAQFGESERPATYELLRPPFDFPIVSDHESRRR